MRTTAFQVVILAVGAYVVGCAGAEVELRGAGTPNAGGASASGGETAAGGTVQTGGISSTGGTATGGAPPATGGANTGGADPGQGGATGGAPPATGGANTGGRTATGGRTTTGGKATSGGASASGGGTGGGAPTTGGASTAGSSATSVSKFVGNITTGNAVDPSGLKYSKYWDQITPENQGKWGSVQSTPSSAFSWSSLDSIYNYAETNKITFKQHCFVWGPQQPNGTPTLAQVENWIKSFCQRYPNTKLIDVVNEPPPHTTPNYTANLGAGEGGSYPWITKAFKLARQYCGNAILILNDYNNVELTGDRNHTVDIVKDIKNNGAPIDAVGCQAHGLKNAQGSTAQTNLAYINSQTGLPIYITEFDIDNADDTAQANSYKTFIPIFWQASYVHGITVWGWIAGRTWETNSGIVNGTSPRAAMTWLMGYLNRPVPPN